MTAPKEHTIAGPACCTSVDIHAYSTMETIAADMRRSMETQFGDANADEGAYPIVEEQPDITKPFLELIPGLEREGREDPSASRADDPIEEAEPVSLDERLTTVEVTLEMIMKALRVLAAKDPDIAEVLAEEILHSLPDPPKKDDNLVLFAPGVGSRGRAQDAAKAILTKLRMGSRK